MSKKKKDNKNKTKLGKGNNNKMKIYMDLIALVISVVSFLGMIGIGIVTIHYYNKEYEYKLDPEIDIMGRIGIQVQQTDENKEMQTYLKNIQICILQKNNLQSAYLINADNTVERLHIDNIENVIETKMENEKKTFSCGEISYQHKFLLLNGLDNSSELYLIYVKSKNGEFDFKTAENIEIWGFVNGYTGNPDYDGELIMAEQYLKILEGIKEYSVD